MKEKLTITFEAVDMDGVIYIFIPIDHYMILAQDEKNIVLKTLGQLQSK